MQRYYYWLISHHRVRLRRQIALKNPFSQKKPTKEYIHVHFYCDEFNKTYVVESGVKHHNPNPLNTTYLMIRIQRLMLILL